ncbi:hypothetical protein ACOJBO_41245 [Rhizobium beringeri]
MPVMAFVVHHRDLIDRAPLRAVLAAQKNALQRHHPVAGFAGGGPGTEEQARLEEGRQSASSTMPVAIAGSWRGSS